MEKISTVARTSNQECGYAAYVLFSDGVWRLKKKSVSFDDIWQFAYGDGRGFTEVACFVCGEKKLKNELTLDDIKAVRDKIIETWMH